MTDKQNTLIHQLDDLLEIERAALLEGNFERLADLVDEKETLIDALNSLEFSEAMPMSDINQKVKRNQALLEQALQGIRSVAHRLSDLRQARKALDTYDNFGRKVRIEPDPGSSVEKRA